MTRSLTCSSSVAQVAWAGNLNARPGNPGYRAAACIRCNALAVEPLHKVTIDSLLAALELALIKRSHTEKLSVILYYLLCCICFAIRTHVLIINMLEGPEDK